MVQRNWQGRVLLVDGDVGGVVPGVDDLVPGHTAGTLTACLDTVAGRVCYTSDAVRGSAASHEPRVLEDPEALGFRRVSERAVAIVE